MFTCTFPKLLCAMAVYKQLDHLMCAINIQEKMHSPVAAQVDILECWSMLLFSLFTACFSHIMSVFTFFKQNLFLSCSLCHGTLLKSEPLAKSHGFPKQHIK